MADDYRIEVRGKESVYYIEGENELFLSAAWGVTPPVLGIPRPELWDHVMPDWLVGRYAIVRDRLERDSGHVIEFDPDEWYVDRLARKGIRLDDLG